jgi:phosphoenolpyruvate carboxylase
MPKIARDLEFLTTCFREVLDELGEAEIAARLPWIGGLAPAPSAEPSPRLHQALSTAFVLLNMVEENAFNQNQRSLQSLGRMDEQSGFWEHTFAALRRAGHSPAEIAAALPAVRVEPVLTAHPTEAKRATILEHHRALYVLLVKRENQMYAPGEQAEIREEIKAVLERLWRTGEIYMEKPDVPSEVRNVLHYLRHVFPDVLPLLARRLRDAWAEAGFDPALLEGDDGFPPRLSFANWVGGDRDGHPMVTAAVTAETLARLRADALAMIEDGLRLLGARLSLSDRLEAPGEALAQRIEDDRALLGRRGEDAVRRNPGEPWRQFVNLIAARMPETGATGGGTDGGTGGATGAATGGGTGGATGEPRPHAQAHEAPPCRYARAEALVDDLRLLAHSLRAAGAARLARTDVTPLIDHVRTFGFHLASLDIRQNSRFHDRAVGQLLRAAGHEDADFGAWDEPKRLRFLNEELRHPRPFTRPGVALGAEAAAVLDCYRAVLAHAQAHGTSGLGALIVSMTRDVSDLLAVYLLAREVGLVVYDGGPPRCLLPVVPLFETIGDLDRSAAILDAFLAHPITRASLRGQSGDGAGPPRQQVMIGYSDSNKDGGIFASLWGLYRAQQRMIEASRRAGVRLRFFHGRGGTISRGAGPTHRFVDALPPGSVDADLRMTEQGEVIAQKYANRVTASYHLELLVAGAARRTIRDAGDAMDAAGDPQGRDHPLAALMDRLAAASRGTYQALVTEPSFLAFFRGATPIDIIERSRIGSRPARRSGQASLDDLRAIPWVFAWNQARFYLPGWYGVGSALSALRQDDADAFALLARVKREQSWPPVHYLLSNVATSVMTADPKIMAAYAGLVADEDLRRRHLAAIAREYQTTRTMLEDIYGGALEAQRPMLARSIALRDEALRALHADQIALLRMWRARNGENGNGNGNGNAEGADDELLTRLLVSVNALASGLGTTG